MEWRPDCADECRACVGGNSVGAWTGTSSALSSVRNHRPTLKVETPSSSLMAPCGAPSGTRRRPCAVVVAEGNRVKWALESLTFPGTIAKWRGLHPESVAARLPERVGSEREREVPGGAWKSGGALVERAWKTRRGRTLSWIVAG
jgi:hypothetical protein